MRSHYRGAMRPSCAKTFRPIEGAGNAGCLLHPRSRVQYVHKNTHTSIQVQSEHSGIPRTMVLRLMPRSPRRRIRLVTVIGGLKVFAAPGWADQTSADLTPATGARTTRFCRTQPPTQKVSTDLVPVRRSFSEGGFSIVRLRVAIAHGPRPALRPRLRARRCRVHRIPSQRI
jgi:hypothetical protein